MGLGPPICLTDVCYAYLEDTPILEKVSLTIPKKYRVAFVGETGAGKSTMVDLILGLRFPQAGELRVDGVEINPVTCHAWHHLIGYVPQSIYLKDAPLAENVAFGLPASQIDMSRVERACKAACLDDVIAGLPSGYQTEVGERGVRLSGGQCQRVGIARALYNDPERPRGELPRAFRALTACWLRSALPSVSSACIDSNEPSVAALRFRFCKRARSVVP